MGKPYKITKLDNPQDIERLDNLLTILFDNSSQPSFVDIGDPNAVHFALAALTTNGAWNDLSLSAIVPVGTKAVVLKVEVKDDAVASSISFRKNGMANAINTAVVQENVVNQSHFAEVIVSCDSNRVIEYLATNTTFTAINITVKGYFK